MKLILPGGSGQIGAILMCTETELVLESRRVVPGILPARELCAAWRQDRT